jgi:hypothetical protein
MKNAPEKIYLQVCEENECDADFYDHEGVTWCHEKIHDSDIEYNRADIAQTNRGPLNHHEFGFWWFEIGSGLHPLEGEDQEQHAYRIASAAWAAAHAVKE